MDCESGIVFVSVCVRACKSQFLGACVSKKNSILIIINSDPPILK